jgi:type VI protein secretion system component Hcp
MRGGFFQKDRFMGELLADVYVKLDGFTGECTDDQHHGDEGWIQIKSFNFGFGMKEGSWDTDSSNASSARTPSGSSGSGSGGGSSGGGGSGSRHSGGGSGVSNLPLEFPEVSITKTSDLVSTRLLKEKCHSGSPIPHIEVVACRYGGNDDENPKIPFLRLIFDDVYITSITFALSQDELPAETIKFTYDIVRMETIWTDNETGDRLTSEPNRCGWNKKLNKPTA